MPKNYTIKDMQSYATDHNGTCLSKEYIDTSTPLKWRCENGHIWEADFQIIRQGGWCVQCEKKQKRLEEVQEIAEKKGGRCISVEYVHSETKLKFECSKGHQWWALHYHIKTGKWCRQCYFDSRRLPIEEVQKIARKYDGKCLSKEFISWHSPMKWQCAKGHTWMAKYANIRRERWCPECNDEKNKKELLASYNRLANKKGGKCLSEKYLNNRSKLKWECANGHQWQATPVIIQSGRWCRQCYADSRRGSIQEMQQIASQRGGKCLSATYTDNDTRLRWQCKEGHSWWATPANVKLGGWCRKCVVNSRKLNISDLQQLAINKGGLLITKQYINAMTKMLWKCENGHKWWASTNDIKHDHWCARCYHERRRATFSNRNTKKTKPKV